MNKPARYINIDMDNLDRDTLLELQDFLDGHGILDQSEKVMKQIHQLDKLEGDLLASELG